MSDQVTSGSPNEGSPLGTVPRIATPCDSRSNAQLTMIDPMTATSAPGITLVTYLNPRMMTITDTETASVVMLVWSRLPSVLNSLAIVLSNV